MKHLTMALLTAITLATMPAAAKDRTVTLRIIQTSDVHGYFFPYDFSNRKPLRGTLARAPN